MKLRRWNRIGVVVSVLWVLAAAYHERGKQVDAATSFAASVTKHCFEARQQPVAECLDKQAILLRDTLYKPQWGDVAFVAFGPVLLAWLLVFIGRKVYSWVRAGEP